MTGTGQSAQSTTEPPHTDERPTSVPENPEPESEPETETQNEEITPSDEIERVVENAAANWDASDARLDARKAAARAVLAAVREQPMSKSEIIDEVYPDHPVEGQSKRTWWRKNLAEGPDAPLKELAEYSNATKNGHGLGNG